MVSVTVGNPYPVSPESLTSPWVRHYASEISRAGTVLDLACGNGRHARWLAALDYQVLAVDRDAVALAGMVASPNIETLCHDLEAAAWPFDQQTFSGIVVTRYLHRPLLPRLVSALAPGGVLIYETFMLGNEVCGRPRREDFLLKPGELMKLALDNGLVVIAFREGFEAQPAPAVTQSLCARRPPC